MPEARQQRPTPPTFEAVFDEHVWAVYGFFAYRLRSRADAEDLTQATFERALRAWGRYDPTRAQVLTWLFTIARNLLIDHQRADRSLLHGAAEEAEGLAGPEERSEIAPELDSALRELGDREREIIALRFGGDLTASQIAGLTGLTVANVQQILSRSLRRLRARLDPAG